MGKRRLGVTKIWKGDPEKDKNLDIDKVIKAIERSAEKRQKKKGKRVRRPDVECQTCFVKFSYANIAIHTRRCRGLGPRQKWKEEKEDLIIKNKILAHKNEKLEVENKLLKIKLKEKNISLPNIDIDQVIHNKSENTKSSYNSQWARYIEWCAECDLDFETKESVFEYYKNLCSQINLRASVINLIRGILIKIFKTLYNLDLSVLLTKKRERKREHKKPKYHMNNKEILSYLYDFRCQPQNLLAQIILIFSGCRVHTLSAIKKCDIASDGSIAMQDYKTNKEIIFKIGESRFNEMLLNYL